MTSLLAVEGLEKSFRRGRGLLGRTKGAVHAVRNVSFGVARGETVALVGESGAGKSTVGRLVLRLLEPDGGVIRLEGADIRQFGRSELRAMRGRVRMVFQDPYSSLDPRQVIGRSVAEPLRIHSTLKAAERRGVAQELLEQVGLPREYADRFPYELSGGQLQRVAVARAISTKPSLIVCDEPVAALDMSVRAQVINLLHDLQEGSGIAYLFVSHDLSLVRLIADRVIVMFQGEIVEEGPTERVFECPTHPYTQALIRAVPKLTAYRRRCAPSAVPTSPEPAILRADRTADPAK